MIRVLVADDQAMVRTGLRLILEGQADIEVVGEATDGEDAQVAVRRDHPDLVLMDIRMPRLDGIAATRKLIEHDPALRILVVTTFDADQYVFEALRAGASGFILKDSSPEQLVAAVRLIAAGDALLAPARTRRLIESATCSCSWRAASTMARSQQNCSSVGRLCGRTLATSYPNSTRAPVYRRSSSPMSR